MPATQPPTAPDLDWFINDRFGLFIHWGLYSLPARHEWVRNFEKISNEDYQKYFDHFDPDLYDPHVWAQEAKNAGMKYAVITTKHHEGFCSVGQRSHRLQSPFHARRTRPAPPLCGCLPRAGFQDWLLPLAARLASSGLPGRCPAPHA